MRSASYPQSSYTQGASLRSRATAFCITAIVNILLLLMLLHLASGFELRPPPKPPTVVELIPEQKVSGARKPTQTKRASGGASSAKRLPKPPTAPKTPPPETPPQPLNLLALSREDFAASDISKLPSHNADRATGGGTGTTGTGQMAGAAGTGNGQGPGGADLYDAQWYREPTQAELSFYLPKKPGLTGYGMIICQTIERYHVDNCRELEDSPPGSGLSNAVRQAAWQFLVQPPRIGGKPLIGAWVRIRIELTPNGGIR